MTTAKYVAQQLRTALRRTGLSGHVVAIRADIGPDVLASLLRGRAESVSLESLSRVAEVVDLKLLLAPAELPPRHVSGPVDSLVDKALKRYKLTDLAGCLPNDGYIVPVKELGFD